ncbi:MAG: hypothetical protein Q4A01_04160 [Coriobacteriales bacterium]|nr:hypothetical protein [Coriobacteriales bacterium]
MAIEIDDRFVASVETLIETVDGASEICIALGGHVTDRCIENSLDIVANALEDASSDVQARLRGFRSKRPDECAEEA